MNKPKVGLATLLMMFSVGSGLSKTVAAEESVRTVRSADVIDLTVQHNPSLRAVLLQVKVAEEAIRAAEGRYPFIFNADTGYTHMSTPLGSSQFRKQDNVSLGAGVSRVFSVGTIADLHLDGRWYQIDSTQRGTLGETASSDNNDSNFGFNAKFSLTQPLIRGFGNRVGLSELRQTRKEKTVAEKTADVAASGAARDVLSAYWDLWLALKTVEINEHSRDVAKAQLEETRQRVASGDAAPVDELAYRTRLASLEETVIASKAEVRRLETALAEKAGTIADGSTLTADRNESLPETRGEMALNDIVKESLAKSPSIQEAFHQVEIAEERLKVAGESMRQRLDFTAWIEAATLAQAEFSPVVTDLGHGGAYSGYVGLIYELPLDNRKKEGERAQARLAVEAATLKLKSAENAVRSSAAASLNAFLAAKERLATAEETLKLAEEQAEAERERYRLGASIFTVVRDAEETVREAELRVVRARIDIVEAEIEIDHLKGDLLKKIAIQK